MSVKYFCDVCTKEVNLGSRIHLMGNSVKINTLCIECWNKAENILLSKNPDFAGINNRQPKNV